MTPKKCTPEAKGSVHEIECAGFITFECTVTILGTVHDRITEMTSITRMTFCM